MLPQDGENEEHRKASCYSKQHHAVSMFIILNTLLVFSHPTARPHV